MERAADPSPDLLLVLREAVALHQGGRLAKAEASYLRVLEAEPEHPHALRLLAVLRHQQGRHAEALDLVDRVLEADAARVEAHRDRGDILSALGRPADAVASYDRALAIEPRVADTHYNRGGALSRLGRFEEAVADYDRALALDPGHALAHGNRGNALLALGRAEEAVASYDEALALKPDDAASHHNRGNALLALGRFEEAVAGYDRAIALRPGSTQAHANRGSALKELGRFADALASLDEAIAIDARHKHAIGAAAECAMRLCDWGWRERHGEELHRAIAERASVVPPFVALVHFDDPALLLRCAETWVGDQVRIPPRPRSRAPAWRNDRIRVAYLSADFRRHATAYLIAELIERHDRRRFEVVGVSFGPDDGSDMRARMAGAFDRFLDVAGTTDEEAARLIGDSRVDIAIDLMGHTQHARPGILAFHPAPIQAGYLGFPGTTGAGFLDYVIADPVVAPFDRQPFFTERIVHLPDCYQVNDSTRVIAARASTREECGLPAEGLVFCCFNTSWKITPAVFDAWMRLLGAVPGSVLWLLHDNPLAEWNLRARATARGVDPARLVFAGRAAPEEHLARHRLADLFLDTLPYNAHTTASDALRAGLPLVTCCGDAFAARVAASLLRAVGLPELVTTSLPDYEALALRLATDDASRGRLRARLEASLPTCPLFDAERFRRHIEAAYETMWEAWQHGEVPRGFGVGPLASPA